MDHMSDLAAQKWEVSREEVGGFFWDQAIGGLPGSTLNLAGPSCHQAILIQPGQVGVAWEDQVGRHPPDSGRAQ